MIATQGTLRREEVIAAARSLIDTKFVHQGRSKFGLDCAGMIVVPLRMCGFDCPDAVGYDRYSAGRAMPETLALFADRIEPREAKLADILTFYRSKPGLEEHIAWFIPPERILQSWIKGGVQEVTFDGRWRERLVGAHRVRGMAA